MDRVFLHIVHRTSNIVHFSYLLLLTSFPPSVLHKFIRRKFYEIGNGDGDGLHFIIRDGKRPDFDAIERIVKRGEEAIASQWLQHGIASMMVLKGGNELVILQRNGHVTVHFVSI